MEYFFGKKIYRLFPFLICLLMVGCGSLQKVDSGPVSKKTIRQIKPEPTTSKPDSSALKHLQDRARQATESGDLESAIVWLERALRLSPSQASTYLELAKLKAATGNLAQALVFAERGLLYCENPICEALKSFIQETTISPGLR